MVINKVECKQVHQTYKAFLENKLPPEQILWIKAHVQDCPDCFLLDTQIRKAILEEWSESAEGRSDN